MRSEPDRPDRRATADDAADDNPTDGEVAQVLAQFDQWLTGDILQLFQHALGETPPPSDSELDDDRAFLARMALVWPRADGAPPHDDSAPANGGPAGGAQDPSRADDRGAADVTSEPRLGRFLIRRVLGKGGAGIVFLAEDPLLRREVALKVPRPEMLVSSAARQRILREAHAAAGLNHPHILPLYEAGEAGPVCYLVSAYCSGPSLAAWLAEQRGPVPLRQAAEWIAQLADAAHYAHSRGVVHRDIKPSNVLLEPSAGPGTTTFAARLTDFGLAKCAARSDGETRTGTVLGTPTYMAPEQASGQVKELGPATDVYSLGVVLYELLTGERPFRAVSDLALLQQITTIEPVSPSRLRREVPPDLSAITLRAMEKAPAARYGSAGELAADLRRYLAGEATIARPLGAWSRLARWGSRNPVTAGSIAVAAVALAIGFAAVTWQWQRAEANLEAARQARHHAEQNWRDQSRLVSEVFRHGGDETRETSAIRSTVRKRLLDYYQQLLADAPQEHSDEEVATACLKRALLLLDRDPGQSRSLLAEGLRRWQTLDRQNPGNAELALDLADAELDAVYICLHLAEFDAARRHVDAAEQRLRAPELPSNLAGDLHYRWGLALHAAAEADLKAQRYAAAADSYRRMADFWEHPPQQHVLAPAGRTANIGRAYRGLADAEYRQQHWEAAIAASRRVIAICAAELELHPRALDPLDQLDRAWSLLAACHEQRGDPTAATEARRAAETSLRQAAEVVAAGNDRKLAELHARLGYLYDDGQDPERALSEFDKAVVLGARLLEDEPENRELRRELARHRFWKARMHAELARADAGEAFEAALATWAGIVGQEAANLDDWGYWARTHFRYGRWLESLGQSETAREHFAEAAAAYRKILAAKPSEAGFAQDLAHCEQVLARDAQPAAP
ncbi:MAG: serine/threonine protein kinase [Planctomycetaceae bacterium]|nr:serine/threonine protein kinase [Planctomycetaceae bacterium]